MASISSFLQELRKRIADQSSSSSSGAASISGEDPFAVQFRKVLPILLRTSTAENEREATAVLKLLSYTARNFPGAFFHGRAAAVLPVIGFLLPFLADTSFCSRHGVIFDTISSLLSLLRTGEREAYCQFFLDTMVALKDVVAYIHANKRNVHAGSIMIKCLSGSFSLIENSPMIFNELPGSCCSRSGPGVLVDLTGDVRWRPFAASLIKFVSKCLAEGTLYVGGLLSISFVSAACSLICYGDANLHMACFDFARITATIVDVDMVPTEKIILSIVCILWQEKNSHPYFREANYDSTMGMCLHALHSCCHDSIVQSTATDLINIFPKALQTASCAELQIAMCSAYKRIAQLCSPSVWKPEILIEALYTSNPCFPLIDCIRLAIGTIDGEDRDLAQVGKKRKSEERESSSLKRQKMTETSLLKHGGQEESSISNPFSRLLFQLVSYLKPDNSQPHNSMRPENTINALNVLCIAMSFNSNSSLSDSIFELVVSWIPWICKQIKEGDPLLFDMSFFLEAVQSILLLQDKRNCISSAYPDLLNILMVAWSNSHLFSPSGSLWKLKCLLIQVFSKLSMKLNATRELELLHLAMHDESEEVRCEAVISLPIFVLFSGPGLLEYMVDVLESAEGDESAAVHKRIVFSLGFLSCLTGFSSCSKVKERSALELFSGNNYQTSVSTLDLLLKRFYCSKCESIEKNSEEALVSAALQVPMLQNEKAFPLCSFMRIHSLFFKLIFGDYPEEVIVSCVQILPRIIRHSSQAVLIENRQRWMECINILLSHKAKAVREEFSGVISCFMENEILTALFTEDAETELKLFDLIESAITRTKDLQLSLTILESVARIMETIDVNAPLFFKYFALLITQLGHHSTIVRLTGLRLIQRSTCFEGGLELFMTKHILFRNSLYDFLSDMLISHPGIIKEFSEAVLGIKTDELVKRMVPIVIPKLVVSHKSNNRAVLILHELAIQLDTEVVSLTVKWLPKVLASALFHNDAQQLSSVLEFYQKETQSDSKEIFAADFKELLEELLCFHGDADQHDTDCRTTRIPMVVKKVSRILTGSDDLPDFLKNYFVGLLNSIDRKMLRNDDPKLQHQGLHRLQKLIEMMGPCLSTHVPKIMVLLIYTIDKEALQSDSLDTLHFFIRQLAELSPSSIKHVMSQIVAAFIPSLERCMECPSVHLDKIVEILRYIIEKKYLLVEPEICKLPLLPSIPALSEVNKKIREARGSRTLRDQLQVAVDGLNHESLNVRYMVACELSKLLNAKREGVTALIGADDAVDLDVVSSLIAALLRGCSEESHTAVGQRLQLKCADCLGSLGAVDPAKFKGTSSERFKIECSDDDLIFELINKHLARAFRATSDTLVQDSAALAIQELLKLAGCQASDSYLNIRGQKLWDRFSNYIKEIIAPCLTSRFLLPSVSDSASVGPIYRTTMSFRRWIYFWIRKLTAHATGSRSSIFSACRGIVRHDMQTALFLLPYLVLNAVCHGTAEARQGITEEMLSVLDAAASEHSGAAVHGITSGQSEVCIQAVFTLLDNLGQWVDDLKQEIALSQPVKLKNENASISASKNGDHMMQCGNVSELLSAIPKVTLAEASFRCQAHARALMYYESHVRNNSGSFNPAAETSGVFSDKDISFLMKIYAGLDEPDGLLGFANLRKSSNLQDQLLISKKSGNWADAMTFCEQALQMEMCSIESSSERQSSVQRHSDVLNCLLNMCHFQAMVAHVDGLICRIPEYKKTWCMQGLQAAWRLGRWDLMDDYLSHSDKEGLTLSGTETNASFDMGLAKIFQAMIKKDQFLVEKQIELLKQALLVPLAAAGMDSYMRAYPYIVKLHMLCELKDFNTLLGEAEASFLEGTFTLNDPKFVKVVEDWENRLRITQPSLWAREPLLAFRRLVYGLSRLNSQVGTCWLQYSKLCRSAGHYETAHHAILEAHASGAANVHMERAKYLWGVRKPDGAIAELQQTLVNMPSDVLGPAVVSSLSSLSLALPSGPLSASQASKDYSDVAKTLLLYTRWIHQTGQKQKEEIISLYSRVRELQPKWEKGYFYMAKYYDDLLVDARRRQEDGLAAKVGPITSGSSSTSVEEKSWWTILPDVLLFYAKGLHRGHKNLFQALPRLLTLWFDFGSIYQREGSASNKPMKTVHTRVLSVMRGCLKDLPTYQWLTVLSQLISRICHQNDEIVRIVKHIITSVLQAYPQQALWMMAAVSKSTVPARREAANEIILAARKGSRHGSENSNLFSQFASLVDHLIKLCFHPGNPKSRSINISTEFSSLKRMMPLGIILPIQQSLTVTLPSFDVGSEDQSSFNVFSASEHVTIAGLTDEAEILSSLQRPKKVVFLGSDGVARPFLCKPKDDLRKDARMMEFNAMINRLLSKYPESRRRKLYIRTFAVVPLTEDCGMVEWVPHTRGLRHILQDIYITLGKFDRQRTNPLIKKIYDQCQGKMPEDEMLKTKILPMFPPVFHKWFLTTFSEPAAWFRARLAYAHTTAVWSMVGHIVGLGDRHGENILFDSTSGDCVHVDFSCLFDRGLLLDKPELVPFRLTQNMIDGLGITGYEGVYLKVCEITLSVLRTHKETLMSVLETFIHDPLVEWTKSHKSSGVEVQNPHAQRAISNIKARLQGVVVGVAAAPSLPLSVEGQARRLIAEAISHKNLGKMYIWWMPWF
ncbi:Serine/threonine-protein kinase ATR [Rhynchospora pubera]|uniref:Serine/threonine-protein kinase ATR n=1 Tax=Rhynchospora pubera TaxID=906938 RepID=A0AAV8GRN6_9POAL|nr:Serine/threonine-protein kinase ATR [Rhynchospora pubera]